MKKITKLTKTANSNSVADFTNQKVSLTGFRDQDINDFIEDNGGRVTTSVSKNTTLVVYVETNKKSSKLKKAEDLGINMIVKDDFVKKYGL